jgi:Tol biopolymer transport system component
MMTDSPPRVAPLPPVPPPFAPPRRTPWKKVVLIVGAVLLTLFVALVVVVLIILHRLNTPATVPASWRPPSALPRSAAVGVAPGNLVFDSNRTGNYEIWTMGPDGTGARELTHDPAYDSWWARLSPDRHTILFYRTPAGTHDHDYSKTSLWAIGADGTDPVELRPAGLDGWVQQGHAEWSPDGTQLVMFGGDRFKPQIQISDDLGQHPRAVTDRKGTNIDPSWSPDGRTVVFVGCPGSFCTPSSHEIYTVPAAGGSVTRLTHDGVQDNDPYFSHRGDQLAWLSKISGGLLEQGVWDIRIMPVVQTGNAVTAAPGAEPRRIIGDDNINSKPSWSFDDQTIYFHRAVYGVKRGFQIWAVHPDGSDLRELTADAGGSNEYPGT